MNLNEYKTIDLSGYEIATLLGILRYIIDFKQLGDNMKYAIDLKRKLEKLRDEK